MNMYQNVQRKCKYVTYLYAFFMVDEDVASSTFYYIACLKPCFVSQLNIVKNCFDF